MRRSNKKIVSETRAMHPNESTAIRINISKGIRVGTNASSQNQIYTLVPQSHSRTAAKHGLQTTPIQM